MGRSVAKGPYVAGRLLQKVERMDRSGRKEAIRTWARGSTVVPQFVGYTFAIHNGRKFIPVYITESMVGHKFGEFAPTRVFRAHSGKKSEKASKTFK
jgi:small subunit ribosomal protein S19